KENRGMRSEMSETRDWKPISTAPERKEVWTKIDDAQGERNVAHLKRIGRLWFFPDGSMYVYYAPTHWAELEAERIKCEAMREALEKCVEWNRLHGNWSQQVEDIVQAALAEPAQPQGKE